jgi:hypothetical protein
MIFESIDAVILKLQENKKPPAFIEKGRADHLMLKQLIEGDGFKDRLLKIENIETEKRAKARKNYSRSIVDFYERLLQPVSNIYNSTGGSKRYEIINDTVKKSFFKMLSNVADDKTLEQWLEDNWMLVYHTDPMGLIMLEYDEEKVYPVYKSINTIKEYMPKGQLVEYVIFEAIKTKVEGWTISKVRVIDDENDYMFYEENGKYTMIPEESYKHPFGQVPCIINSNIIKTGTQIRLSPISKVVEISEEYLRDQSIKTLYKFLHGFPIHWRYIMQCPHCTGTGKTSEGLCKNCDGLGYLMKNDVTDVAGIPIPEKDEQKIAPEIAGYIAPDLATWSKYVEELNLLWDIAYNTHWGTTIIKADNETATGRYIDVQPVINRLNKYANTAQWVEWKLSEWLVNFLQPTKAKEDVVCAISYGRRYIIESPDVIIEKYQKSKAAGDNTVILDRLFGEFLTSKFKNDPEFLRVNLMKAKLEPYIHYTIVDVNTMFGQKEAQKKMMFTDWWDQLTDADMLKPIEALRTNYQKWFEEQEINEMEDEQKSKEEDKVEE